MKLIRTKSQTQNPWHLFTVTQVKEVKCVLRLLPIWLCTIFYSVVFTQMLTLFIEQGAVMNRTISNFHIPPAGMTIFDFICTSLFIVLYDRLIIPVYVKVTKQEPKTPNALQRIGIGLAIASVDMIVAGIVEQQRLNFSSDFVGEETSSLSILWQIPQYVLVGASDAFIYVARMEFFASQHQTG